MKWLSVCAKSNGLVLPSVPDAHQAPRVFERSLVAMLGADADAQSVGFNLRALRQAASNVRERLSQEQRNLIDRVDSEFALQMKGLSQEDDFASQEALEALEEASELLSAITG
ncbi:alpha-E domain-containing protein, partial [Arthrospira platensis SPKY1]|nr:alpha-E domain-containing protein [Arthrospira platensis SPKY1]